MCVRRIRTGAAITPDILGKRRKDPTLGICKYCGDLGRAKHVVLNCDGTKHSSNTRIGEDASRNETALSRGMDHAQGSRTAPGEGTKCLVKDIKTAGLAEFI